jgi:hypothetical protein
MKKGLSGMQIPPLLQPAYYNANFNFIAVMYTEQINNCLAAFFRLVYCNERKKDEGQFLNASASRKNSVYLK